MNYNRLIKKLPKGAQQAKMTRGIDGSVESSAIVPGRVPGSFAQYSKTVDVQGATTGYLKKTVGNKGQVAHTKDKFTR